ncbi:MAG TPA: Uma2 family endonuclease [Thermoanaerobaculia bacterium]|nr:Uma2 family endonuclease [Thermoanaerobaculia bacterium]
MSAIPLEQEMEYPTSDGQPMAETTLHRKVMADLIEALDRRYASVPDVWVGGNLFLCYRKGDPSAALAPDVLLARGVTKWDRPNYLLWEETPPALVVEVTSRKTRGEDRGKKKEVYERIGVEEYVLFDPYGDWLRPRLQGFRLEGGRYQAIVPAEDGSLASRTTGLILRAEGERLRLFDPAAGKPLLWTDELEGARAEAEAALAGAEAALAQERAARARAEALAAEEAAARRKLEERLRELDG